MARLWRLSLSLALRDSQKSRNPAAKLVLDRLPRTRLRKAQNTLSGLIGLLWAALVVAYAFRCCLAAFYVIFARGKSVCGNLPPPKESMKGFC